ncbi:MAG: hypothetical protein KTR21_00220 [Rhodobacteraceae bacterium]|nr:hypothetical protein [Paracoccaceae bacterium]
MSAKLFTIVAASVVVVATWAGYAINGDVNEATASPSSAEAVSVDLAHTRQSIDKIIALNESLTQSVATLKDELRGIQSRFDGLDAQLSGLSHIENRLAAIESATDALSSAAASMADIETSAIPAVAAPEPDVSQKLMDQIGSDGIVLRIGQTEKVDGSTLFLSRLTETDAYFFVDRQQRDKAGIYDGPLRLSDDCALDLRGVHEGTAYIARDCG